VFTERGVPASARVDYPAAQDAHGEIRRALRSTYQGWQDTLSESTGLSARDGSFVAWSTPTPDSIVVARRNVGMAACSTLHETGIRRTKAERARWRTNMSRTTPGRIYGTTLRVRSRPRRGAATSRCSARTPRRACRRA
jgi:hypothetical protein